MTSPDTDARRLRYDRLMEEADSLLRVGSYDDAVTHFAAAAELARDGGAMPELGTALHRAAVGRDRQGATEEAVWFATQALRVDESCFGPVHPAVARDLHSLGVVLARSGKLEAAVGHLQRSVDISARFQSVREQITTLLALGQAQHGGGAPTQAALTFSTAAQLATTLEGPQGRHAVRALLSMASAQAAGRQLPGAHATWAEVTRRLAGDGVPPPELATALARAWQGLGTLALQGRDDRADAAWMFLFAMSLVPSEHPVHVAAAASLAVCGRTPSLPDDQTAYVVVVAPEGADRFDVARPTGGRFTLSSSVVSEPVTVGQLLQVRFGDGGGVQVDA